MPYHIPFVSANMHLVEEKKQVCLIISNLNTYRFPRRHISWMVVVEEATKKLEVNALLIMKLFDKTILKR